MFRTVKISKAVPTLSLTAIGEQRNALTSPEAATISKVQVTSQLKNLDAQVALNHQQTVQGTRNIVTAASALATTGSAASDTGELSNADFHGMIAPLFDAIELAVDQWKLQAHFQNITVNAISAIGARGCLTGPEIAPLMRFSPQLAQLLASNASAPQKAICNGIIDGLSTCFAQWQDNVTVPGLPWYPAFAAFPGPVAPPMPNVPMPLITCISDNLTAITVGNTLKNTITQGLPAPQQTSQIIEFVGRFSDAVAMGFSNWLPSSQVMLVLGKGPVPTFAPPYVPVGPVLGGDIIAAPGHLLAAPKLNFALKAVLFIQYPNQA